MDDGAGGRHDRGPEEDRAGDLVEDLDHVSGTPRRLPAAPRRRPAGPHFVPAGRVTAPAAGPGTAGPGPARTRRTGRRAGPARRRRKTASAPSRPSRGTGCRRWRRGTTRRRRVTRRIPRPPARGPRRGPTVPRGGLRSGSIRRPARRAGAVGAPDYRAPGLAVKYPRPAATGPGHAAGAGPSFVGLSTSGETTTDRSFPSRRRLRGTGGTLTTTQVASAAAGQRAAGRRMGSAAGPAGSGPSSVGENVVQVGQTYSPGAHVNSRSPQSGQARRAA